MEKLMINEENLEVLKLDFKKGIPIAVPTDTNYNLICDPYNKEAVNLIFKYKQRSFDKPLSLFFLEPHDILKYAKDYDYEIVNCIISNFLPGPLNIILNKNTTGFDAILNGSESIAFGCIKNESWRALVKALDSPVALTSANISGTADNQLVDETMLVNQMSNNLSHYVAGFDKKHSKSSTIIKILNNKISIIREGDITLSAIEASLKKAGIVYES